MESSDPRDPMVPPEVPPEMPPGRSVPEVAAQENSSPPLLRSLLVLAGIAGLLWHTWEFVPAAASLPLLLAVRCLGLGLFLAAAYGWGLGLGAVLGVGGGSGSGIRDPGAGSRDPGSAEAEPEAVVFGDSAAAAGSQVAVARHPLVALALGLGATGSALGWIAPWLWPGGGMTSLWLLGGLVLLSRPQLRATASPVAWPRLSGGEGALAAALLAAPLTLALATPTAIDSLVYHLTLPRQFALAGHAFATPWNAHGLFPFNGEVLFALIWPLGDEVLPALLHLAAAVATMVLVVEQAAKFGGRAAGRWSAVALGSIPVLMLSAGAAYTDYFVLLPLAAVLQIFGSGNRGRGRELEMAVLLGSAAAAKTNGLPLTLLVLLPWWHLPIARKVLVAVVGLVAALPWTVHTFRATGDLFFPVIASSAQAAALAGYRQGSSLGSYLLDLLGTREVYDESLGPLIALVVALVLLRRRGDPGPPWIAGLVALLYPVALLLMRPTSRFLAPALLIGVLFAAAPLGRLLAGSRRKVWSALLVVVAIAAGVETVGIWHREEPLDSALALQPPAARRAERYPLVTIGAVLDENTGADEGVLVVAESRVLHFRRQVVAGTYVDPHPLVILVPEDRGAGEDARHLIELGLRWVAFVPGQCYVGRRPPGTTRELVFFYDAESAERFARLLEQHAELVLQDGGQWLYRLSEAPVDTPPVVERCRVFGG